jgi:hypothetical protein
MQAFTALCRLARRNRASNLPTSVPSPIYPLYTRHTWVLCKCSTQIASYGTSGSIPVDIICSEQPNLIGFHTTFSVILCIVIIRRIRSKAERRGEYAYINTFLWTFRNSKNYPISHHFCHSLCIRMPNVGVGMDLISIALIWKDVPAFDFSIAR